MLDLCLRVLAQASAVDSESVTGQSTGSAFHRPHHREPVLWLAGCTSTRNAQDWRIAFSFEDDLSCGYFRSLLIFDDGQVDYTISHIPGAEKTSQIGLDEAAHLVAWSRTLRGSTASLPIVRCGGSAEIRVLRDEVAYIPVG